MPRFALLAADFALAAGGGAGRLSAINALFKLPYVTALWISMLVVVFLVVLRSTFFSPAKYGMAT